MQRRPEHHPGARHRVRQLSPRRERGASRGGGVRGRARRYPAFGQGSIRDDDAVLSTHRVGRERLRDEWGGDPVGGE